MVDEIRRNHDTTPTQEEQAWMDQDFMGGVIRGLVLGVFALAIGAGVSLYLEPETPPASIAAAVR